MHELVCLCYLTAPGSLKQVAKGKLCGWGEHHLPVSFLPVFMDIQDPKRFLKLSLLQVVSPISSLLFNMLGFAVFSLEKSHLGD